MRPGTRLIPSRPREKENIHNDEITNESSNASPKGLGTVAFNTNPKAWVCYVYWLESLFWVNNFII